MTGSHVWLNTILGVIAVVTWVGVFALYFRGNIKQYWRDRKNYRW